MPTFLRQQFYHLCSTTKQLRTLQVNLTTTIDWNASTTPNYPPSPITYYWPDYLDQHNRPSCVDQHSQLMRDCLNQHSWWGCHNLNNQRDCAPINTNDYTVLTNAASWTAFHRHNLPSCLDQTTDLIASASSTPTNTSSFTGSTQAMNLTVTANTTVLMICLTLHNQAYHYLHYLNWHNRLDCNNPTNLLDCVNQHNQLNYLATKQPTSLIEGIVWHSMTAIINTTD